MNPSSKIGGGGGGGKFGGLGGGGGGGGRVKFWKSCWGG